VPDDIGFFKVDRPRGYLTALGPRIGTLITVLFHKRWMDWRLYRDTHPPTLVHDNTDLIIPKQPTHAGGAGGEGTSGEGKLRVAAKKALVKAENGAGPDIYHRTASSTRITTLSSWLK